MQPMVVLTYNHLGDNIQNLLEDILRYRGTVNSLGYRWQIIVASQYASLLVMKYPDLIYSTSQVDSIQSFSDITVRIA